MEWKKIFTFLFFIKDLESALKKAQQNHEDLVLTSISTFFEGRYDNICKNLKSDYLNKLTNSLGFELLKL